VVQDAGATNDVCSDVSQLGALTLKLYHELQRRGMWRLFDELEAPLSVILALLELRGIHVNADVMHRSRDTLQVSSSLSHILRSTVVVVELGFFLGFSFFFVKPENVKSPHVKFS